MRTKAIFAFHRVLALAFLLAHSSIMAAVINPSQLPQDFDGILLSTQSIYEVQGSADGAYGSFAAYSVDQASLGQGYLLRYGLAASSTRTGSLWAYISSAYSLNGSSEINHEIHLYFDDINPSPGFFGEYSLGQYSTAFFLNDDALLGANGYDYRASDRPVPTTQINMDTGQFVCLADCFVEIALNLPYVQVGHINGTAQVIFSAVGSQAATLFQYYGGGNRSDENGNYTIYEESRINLNIAPVPLPGSLWLLFSSLAGLTTIKHKNNRR